MCIRDSTHGHQAQASDILGLNRSTLRYRLKKAGEVLGLDLRDSGEALDVQVALRAARVLRVHRG